MNIKKIYKKVIKGFTNLSRCSNIGLVINQEKYKMKRWNLKMSKNLLTMFNVTYLELINAIEKSELLKKSC